MDRGVRLSTARLWGDSIQNIFLANMCSGGAMARCMGWHTGAECIKQLGKGLSDRLRRAFALGL